MIQLSRPFVDRAHYAAGEKIAVLLPLALAGPLDYRVDDGAGLELGAFVEVPLGRSRAIGVVWGEGSPGMVIERCRAVLRRLDLPPLPVGLCRFIAWVAAYTLSSEGMVLKMAMSVPSALAERKQRRAYRVAPVLPAGLKLTEPRRRVLDRARVPLTAADMARAADVSPAVVKGLIDAGALVEGALSPEPVEQPDWRHPGPSLSPDQARAATALTEAVAGGFSVHLLEGVTGSGKTEVYFEAVAAALAAGRQVLVLLPEIALSAQWLSRFAARFGAAPEAWHSELGEATRRDAWGRIARGEAQVVVGARSALFLPFPDLGLIVVDEEHDASFKQEEGVIYNARDMAVVRARLAEIPVVLASATPSLETRFNAEAGRYHHLLLPSRHGGALMPRIELVDLRRQPPVRRSWLSPPLIAAIEETLAEKEQVMLFLNRRGYAPLTLCRVCGHRLQCPNCTAWLVEHRAKGRLECHHCGYTSPLPQACPACQAEDSFAACGPGVERLAEEAKIRFPEMRLAIMASDTLTGPLAAQTLVQRMADRDIDLLIGTQTVAKGHHFPLLTLVGVVDADLGLAGGDLRAAERTFQLLSQVAGRAGRGERPGRVLLQTYQPEHKVMQALASGEGERFYAEEADERRSLGMPPYGRLAAVIVSGERADRVDETAAALARVAPDRPGFVVLGPAPAPLALLRGRHRRRFLVKATRSLPLQNLLRDWLKQARVSSGVRIQIDIDPYSFL